MITLEDITRTKLSRPRMEGTTPEPSLMEDVKEILGYGRPTPQEPAVSALRLALAEQEIDILDWKQVHLYQLEQLFKEDMESKKRDLASAREFDGQEKWFGRQWAQVEISKYTGTIPEYVLRKALQIKKACPEAELIVEHLTETPDPFLIARVKKDWKYEAYYVEVWDESFAV